ncbi:hypothetical protein ACFL2K_00915 [Candidatus Margulisiibacteriota bacterium]
MYKPLSKDFRTYLKWECVETYKISDYRLKKLANQFPGIKRWLIYKLFKIALFLVQMTLLGAVAYEIQKAHKHLAIQLIFIGIVLAIIIFIGEFIKAMFDQNLYCMDNELDKGR